MTDQHPLTDEICERIVQYACYSEAERIIDQRCRARLLYPHSHRPLMTHPTDPLHLNMRAAADWQLEQVIEWMRDNLQDHRYSGIGILVDYVIEDFREAMRPTTKYEVISDDY